MIIDCHAHLVPPSLLEDIKSQAAKFPSVRLIEDGASIGFSFAGGKPTRPVSKPLSDLPGRLKWMDEQKIERQVVAGWLDMYGNDLPAAEGAVWSRLINEHLAQTAKAEPRFIPLATVPTQDGKLAAEVLREAHAAGFKGVMIGTQTKGKGGVLDDPALDPFWEAANELGSIVSPHPVFESGDDRVHDYGMANAVGRVTDTMIAVSRMIYAGHFTRFPNMKFLALIGGAGAALRHGPPAHQLRARQKARRPRRRAGRDVLRHHRSGPAHAALSRRYRRCGPADDGLGHAVPDRRSFAAEDRGRYEILRCGARLHQWRSRAEAVRTLKERVMKLDIGGEETIQATVEQLWSALNDPLVLTRCIPGCKTMTEIAPDNYKVEMQLRVAAVGGSFEGEISLFDKVPPNACSIKVSGAGTLGHGNGSATFEIIPEGPNMCRLKFQGVGEIGGLVAGVGQRILTSVSKHLVGKFFTTLRKEFDNPVAGAA